VIGPDPRRAVLLVIAMLVTPCAAAPAKAQTRPLQTEEAATGAAGRLVLEAGAAFMSDEPNFLTGAARKRWDAPVLNLVYSPAANVELDVEWVGRVVAVDDPRFGTASDFGDVTLRAKLLLLDEYQGRPALSVRFGVTLPETNEAKGLGPNTLRMSAQALVSKSFGRFQAHANAGLAIQDTPLSPHLQSDFLAYGVAVVYTLGEKLDLVAEGAGLVGHGHPGAAERNELRAGIRYGTGSLRWDAAVRRGLSEADGTWGFTAGVTWTLKAER
jgi:hypothetical protein